MDFKEKLDSLVRVNIEVSDLREINVEVYSSISSWQNHMYTFVNAREPYKIREDVQTLGISILEIRDPESLEKFRSSGSRTTFYDVSLDRIKKRLDEGSYTHLFVESIGELDEAQISALKEWLSEKLDRVC